MDATNLHPYQLSTRLQLLEGDFGATNMNSTQQLTDAKSKNLLFFIMMLLRDAVRGIRLLYLTYRR